jgi:hypothetical protein
MTEVTLTGNKSTVALPVYGLSILVFEFAAGANTKTITLANYDGGQGISTILASIESGSGVAPGSSTWGGTVVTIVSATATSCIVVGR